MHFIALLSCVLFIFCHGPRHHHRAHTSVAAAKSEAPQAKAIDQGATQDATGKSCATITKGFDSWGNQDDWVSEFPVAQQHRVLVCLDKLAKKQGLSDGGR